jgi:hypothetical protein
MVNNCPNSGCGKPLLYLPEGRIFIFEASAGPSDPGARRSHRLDHYWLCGVCAETMTIVQNALASTAVLPKLPVARGAQQIAPVSSMLAPKQRGRFVLRKAHLRFGTSGSELRCSSSTLRNRWHRIRAKEPTFSTEKISVYSGRLELLH